MRRAVGAVAAALSWALSWALSLALLGCRAASVAVPAAALPPPDAFALVGAGDIADCSSSDDERTGELVRSILDQRPLARAFTIGDNAYPTGSLEQFERCYLPSWGSFRERTIATAGNHDWLTDNAAGFRQTFGVDATAPLYRSEEVGPWHVVVVDSDCAAAGACTPGSAQLAWLAADLAAHRASCTLVLAHHPRFSSGMHGPSALHQPLWETLVAGGADVVLHGHDHHYERFQPLDAAGQPNPSGARPFIVGTGGRSAYPLGDTPAIGSQVRHTGRAGVLVLTLTPSSYRFAFVTVDGEVADQGTASCGLGP